MPGRIYYSRSHDPLLGRLKDAAIGLSVGIPLAVAAWLLTMSVVT